MYVLPYVALFSSVIGTEDTPDYCSTVPLPPVISDAAVFIRDVLEDFAFQGRPLLSFVANTLHAAFLANNLKKKPYWGGRKRGNVSLLLRE